MTDVSARTETRHTRTRMLAMPLVLALVAGGAGGPGTAGAADAIVDPGDEWPLPNQDYGNTRSAPSAAIDSSNVDALRVAWTMDLPATAPSGAAAGGLVIDEGLIHLPLRVPPHPHEWDAHRGVGIGSGRDARRRERRGTS